MDSGLILWIQTFKFRYSHGHFMYEFISNMNSCDHFIYEFICIFHTWIHEWIHIWIHVFALSFHTWINKTSDIWIQGFYQGSRWLSLGLNAMLARAGMILALSQCEWEHYALAQWLPLSEYYLPGRQGKGLMAVTTQARAWQCRPGDATRFTVTYY